MSRYEAKKERGVVLNLSNNTERETILNLIIASGEFEIHDKEGVVTLYFKKEIQREQCAKLSRKSVQRARKILKFGFGKQKKHIRILEGVAKSQNIKLAAADTLDAVCSGIII